MQKTNPKSYEQDQEGRAEHYADITIYAVDQAKNVPSQTSYNSCELTNTQQCLIQHSLFSG